MPTVPTARANPTCRPPWFYLLKLPVEGDSLLLFCGRQPASLLPANLLLSRSWCLCHGPGPASSQEETSPRASSRKHQDTNIKVKQLSQDLYSILVFHSDYKAAEDSSEKQSPGFREVPRLTCDFQCAEQASLSRGSHAAQSGRRAAALVTGALTLVLLPYGKFQQVAWGQGGHVGGGLTWVHGAKAG